MAEIPQFKSGELDSDDNHLNSNSRPSNLSLNNSKIDQESNNNPSPKKRSTWCSNLRKSCFGGLISEIEQYKSYCSFKKNRIELYVPVHIIEENKNKILLVINRFIMFVIVMLTAIQLSDLKNKDIPLIYKVIDWVLTGLLLIMALVTKYKNVKGAYFSIFLLLAWIQ